jgi:hypothetical protein
MSREEFLAMVAKRRTTDQPKPSKYGNVRTELDGHTFDSKAEARRYTELKQLVRAGEIAGFGIQPSFVIARGARYIADFIVWDNDGNHWVEDVKSPATAKNSTFVLKARLFREKYPCLELRLIM